MPILLLLCCFFPVFGYAADWNLNANGAWNNDSNWTPATFPNAVDATAVFPNINSATRTVTLGQDVTVGSVTFQSTQSYNVTGSDHLIFQTTSGDASLAVFTGATHTISSPITLSSPLTLNYASAFNFTLSGIISGPGGFTKTGSGSAAVILSGANTYAGATNINTGIVNYNTDGAFPAGTIVTLGADPTARVNINTSMTAPNALAMVIGTNATVAPAASTNVYLTSLTGSGSLELGTGTAMVDLTVATDMSFNGFINGGAAGGSDPTTGNRFLKRGTGRLTLANTNIYSTSFFIMEGAVRATANNAFSSNLGNTYVQAGACAEIAGNCTLNSRLTLNGDGIASTGALRNVSGTNTLTNTLVAINVATPSTIAVDTGSTLIVSGQITGSQNLTKIGEGTLSLTGIATKSLSGALIINEGVVGLDQNSVTTLTGAVTLNSGGTILAGVDNATLSLAALTMNGGTFNLNGHPTRTSGLVFNTGTILQTGSEVLTVNSAGPTGLTMGDGRTIPGNVSFAGTTGITYNGTTTRGAILGNLGFVSNVGIRSFNIGQGTDSVDFEILGVVSGSPAVTKTGLGVLRFSGTSANTYSGAVTISGGEMSLNKTAGLSALAGSANTTINATGILSTNAANQLSTTRVVTLGGGTFALNGHNQEVGRLVFNSGTYDPSGGALTVNSSLAAALSMGDGTGIGGPIAFASTGGFLYNGTTSLATISGDINLGSFDHAFDITNGIDLVDVECSGAITGTGGITKSGGVGTLQFSGSTNNTYSGLTTINTGEVILQKSPGVTGIAGDVTIAAGATLSLGQVNQLGSNSIVTLNGGTFSMNGNATTAGSFIFNSGTFTQGDTLTLASAASTALTLGDNTSITGPLTFSTTGGVTYTGNTTAASISGDIELGSGDHTFAIASLGTVALDCSGVIGGNGGVIKSSGTGVLQFSGSLNNTYTGNTLIDGGELRLFKNLGVVAIPGDVEIGMGGTLSLLEANQLSNASSVTVNGGTFVLNGHNEEISSLILNSGAVSQGGATLSIGSNSASAITMGDGTTIDGPLAFTNTGGIVYTGGSSGATISDTVDLGGSSHFVMVTSDVLDFSGVIGGSGMINKNTGTGTLRFTGASSNLYVGLTTITTGTLELQKSVSTAAIPGDLLINGGTVITLADDQFASGAALTLSSGAFNLNNTAQTLSGLTGASGTTISLGSGELTINNTTPYTITSAISGVGGSLVKEGSGTLTLDGLSNTYSGLTTINAGILEGSTFSIPGSIVNDGELVLNQTSSASFTDTITGSGSLVKTGVGALTLTNNNSLAGSTALNQGSLIVNGTYAGGGSCTTAFGTILGGSGTITQNCTISGTLSPGNSIGTIHLVGAQALAANSTLEIEVSPTASDLLDIVGTLSIGSPVTLALVPDLGDYTGVQSYKIIETTGGVTGTFSNVSNTYLRFSPTVRYTATQVFLDVTVAPLVSLVTTGNALAVATVLDVLELTAVPGSDLAYVISQINSLPTSQALQSALLQLQPSAFTSLAVMQQTSSITIKNALWNRLEQELNSCLYLNRDRHLNFWFSVLGEWSSQNNYGEEPGFQATTPGVLVGVDYLLNRHACVGASLAYTNTSFNWKMDRGSAEIQAGYLSLYGELQYPLWHLEASLIGAYNHYHIDRYIQFAQINRTAKSSHNGFEGSANIKGALIYEMTRATISPFVDVNYFYLYQSPFTEWGADSLNLSVSHHNASLLESALGLDISRCFWSERKNVTPFFQVSLIRESRFQGSYQTASFSGGPNMIVKGAYPARFLGQVEVGVNITSTQNAPLLSLYYIGRYASHFHTNSFSCTFVF